MSSFGEQLIRLRAESKLSLKEICKQVGIPPSRLVELERGIRIPTAGQIKSLENFYGVNSGALAELADSLKTTERQFIKVESASK
jgi:transcriptional regulator with XRE-family HTH domain